MTARTSRAEKLRLPFKTLSQSMNRPSVTLSAIVIALALGAMRLPFLQDLRPLGDFYVALLKICVLPFLLATIPLAVRSAMASGSVEGTIDRLSSGYCSWSWRSASPPSL
jgi:hypothetical protein